MYNRVGDIYEKIIKMFMFNLNYKYDEWMWNS